MGESGRPKAQTAGHLKDLHGTARRRHPRSASQAVGAGGRRGAWEGRVTVVIVVTVVTVVTVVSGVSGGVGGPGHHGYCGYCGYCGLDGLGNLGRCRSLSPRRRPQRPCRRHAQDVQYCSIDSLLPPWRPGRAVPLVPTAPSNRVVGTRELGPIGTSWDQLGPDPKCAAMRVRSQTYSKQRVSYCFQYSWNTNKLYKTLPEKPLMLLEYK